MSEQSGGTVGLCIPHPHSDRPVPAVPHLKGGVMGHGKAPKNPPPPPLSGPVEVAPMTGMCPYCGRIVRVRRSLTASHHNQVESCPGSGQPPRNAESDARPLWNGKPNPHSARAQEVAS